MKCYMKQFVNSLLRGESIYEIHGIRLVIWKHLIMREGGEYIKNILSTKKSILMVFCEILPKAQFLGYHSHVK